MFYYARVYFRYVCVIFGLLLLSLIAFEVSKLNGEVVFSWGDFSLYTKQSVLVGSGILLVFVAFKILGFFVWMAGALARFKYAFAERFEVFRSTFNIGQKSDDVIVRQILSLKNKGLYRQALKVSSENYVYSDRVMFYHLFLLLKIGKRREFLRLFTTKPCGRAVRLFTSIYLKRKPAFMRTWSIRSLYFKNPDSQVFTYIYAESLFKRGKLKLAKDILANFMNYKHILMGDLYTSYLMNLLAMKIERLLYSDSDFTYKYKENIEKYHEIKRK